MAALSVSLAVATAFQLNEPINARLLVLDAFGEPLVDLVDGEAEIRVCGFGNHVIAPVPAPPYNDLNLGTRVTPTLVTPTSLPGNYALHLRLPPGEPVWPDEAVVRVTVRRHGHRGEGLAGRPTRTREQMLYETAQSLNRSLTDVERRLSALETFVRAKLG
ncbi:MAG: hypothetical protein U0Q12_15255 [Vicinamibacterales bacterium]